jgi:hypothetical protein
MHFASELPLSQGDHGMNVVSQKMIIQANPGLTFFYFDLPSPVIDISQGQGCSVFDSSQ